MPKNVREKHQEYFVDAVLQRILHYRRLSMDLDDQTNVVENIVQIKRWHNTLKNNEGEETAHIRLKPYPLGQLAAGLIEAHLQGVVDLKEMVLPGEQACNYRAIIK